jgi:oxalate decarboxylase/phosphoglucose isomerase-like protein (cupin superfamily)
MTGGKLMDLNRRTLLETLAGVLAAGTILQAAEVRSVLLDPHQVPAETHPFGSQRLYCNGSTNGLKSLVIGSLILKPGEQPHPPHTHPDEEILLVTEGTGQITMNGKASSVGPGALMYVTPNYLHGILNTGGSPLTFYFVKWIAKSA